MMNDYHSMIIMMNRS